MYSRNELIFLKIDTFDEALGVWGRILRSEKMDNRNIFKRQIQIEFIYVDEFLREKLVRFINKKQREKARNESLSF